MGKLRYLANTSLDGYLVDADGTFGWAAPSIEVLDHITELERPVGTYLYGRRMYDTMRVWETDEGLPPETQDYAQVWRAAAKIVYSRTLASVSTARTELLGEFDPDQVRALKADSETDLSVGGADLAGQAFAAGLIDEYLVFVFPTAVGGGTPALPLGQRISLELTEQRRFGTIAHLRYRVG
jgi:dihydrofolate reductase